MICFVFVFMQLNFSVDYYNLSFLIFTQRAKKEAERNNHDKEKRGKLTFDINKFKDQSVLSHGVFPICSSPDVFDQRGG